MLKHWWTNNGDKKTFPQHLCGARWKIVPPTVWSVFNLESVQCSHSDLVPEDWTHRLESEWRGGEGEGRDFPKYSLGATHLLCVHLNALSSSLLPCSLCLKFKMSDCCHANESEDSTTIGCNTLSYLNDLVGWCIYWYWWSPEDESCWDLVILLL